MKQSELSRITPAQWRVAVELFACQGKNNARQNIKFLGRKAPVMKRSVAGFPCEGRLHGASGAKQNHASAWQSEAVAPVYLR